jgi:type I restriction enzyme S subunit
MNREVLINDICDVYDGPHATPKRIQSGPIYLGIKAISEGGSLLPSEFTYLSNEDYKKWTKRVTPQENDIVFSYEATIGRYAIIPKGFHGCLGRRLAVVRAKNDDVNIKWLYYYFKSPKWEAFIANHIVYGSTVLRISVEEFPFYPVLLPERAEQDAIATILDNIDRKIALNNAINAELEKAAKLLYDYWFVQFDFPDANGKPYRTSGGVMEYNEILKYEIPKGWGLRYVGDMLLSMTNTERIQKSDYKAYGIAPIIDQSEEYIAGYTDNLKAIIKNRSGIIVFGDHTRVLKYVDFDFARGADGTQILLSNCNAIPQLLFYHSLKSIDLSNFGYARHFKFLKESPIAIPEEEVATKFHEIVTPLYKQITKNIFMNIELKRFRDFLLPLLMNGQVTVADVKVITNV